MSAHGVRELLWLLTEPSTDMKCIPDNANTRNRAARNNSLMQDVEKIKVMCVCVCVGGGGGWCLRV